MSTSESNIDMLDISEAVEPLETAAAPEKQDESNGAPPQPPEKKNAQRPGLLAFTLMVIYKNLYILGITLMRRGLRFRRGLWRRWQNALDWIAYFQERIMRSAALFLLDFRRRIVAPFKRIKSAWIEAGTEIRNKREKGKFPFSAYLAVADAVWRLIFKIFSTIFNYTAPVVAVFVLISVIRSHVDEPMVRVVEYAGTTLGYVQNDSEFTAATQVVRTRLTTGTSIPIETPHFTLMSLSDFEQLRSEGKIPWEAGRLSRSDLADKIIRASGSEVDEAYGLYINNRFYGAVRNKDILLNEFDRIKSANLTGRPDEVTSFTKRISLRPLGLYPLDAIKPEKDILAIINSNETPIETYTVQTGDTPTGIADKTGVPYAILRELNPDLEEKMFEGLEVLTQVAKPFLPVQSTYTEVVEEPVPFATVEVQNATFVKGYESVIQEGQDGLRLVTYSVTSQNGLVTGRTELEFQMLQQPVDKRVTVGIQDPTRVVTPISPPQSSGSGQASAQPKPQAPVVQPNQGGFIRPVAPGVGYVSCYLNGYRGHTGIDIAVIGGTGTPIMASASGTVVLARNTGVGYGRYIIIDHGNGYQTLYAHNSQLYVTVGQYVQQGEVIAAMGRTGNATGVHCHFEIRYNGRIMNPVNYIGSR